MKDYLLPYNKKYPNDISSPKDIVESIKTSIIMREIIGNEYFHLKKIEVSHLNKAIFLIID